MSIVAIQKQPVGGALLSDVLLASLSTAAPVTPHYLIKSKEPVDVNMPAKADMRSVSHFATPHDSLELTVWAQGRANA